MKPINSSLRLMAAIDQILDRHPKGISEYDLIVELDKNHHTLYPKPDLGKPLLLFQHHFFLRHTLYLLQDWHTQKGIARIDFNAIKIIKTLAYTANNTLPSRHDPLRNYYLDLSNLNNEDDSSVQALLNEFWKTMRQQHLHPQAHKVLGLTGKESAQEKQARYRQLVQQHHPDKGGDPEHFLDIQEAWQLIKK